MNPKIMVVSAISQTQKEIYCIVSLYKIYRSGKFIETETRLEFTKR